MDKLLTLDANELDLVVQYPQATRQMVRGGWLACPSFSPPGPLCLHPAAWERRSLPLHPRAQGLRGSAMPVVRGNAHQAPLTPASLTSPSPITTPQVDGLLGVLEAQGAAALETYRVPLLSWEEAKALKGPGTVGLALGSSADAPPTPPQPQGRPAPQPLAVEAREEGGDLPPDAARDTWSPPAVDAGIPVFEELD